MTGTELKMQIHGSLHRNGGKTLAGKERGGWLPRQHRHCGEGRGGADSKGAHGQRAEKHLSDVREGQGKPFQKGQTGSLQWDEAAGAPGDALRSRGCRRLQCQRVGRGKA